MRRILCIASLTMLYILTICPSHASLKRDLRQALRTSITHKTAQAQQTLSLNGKILKSFEDGELKTASERDWVSGFLPASLWLLYEYSQEEQLKNYAEELTRRLEHLKNYPHTHDLGFMVFGPFGNAYRITQEPYYKEVIEHTATTLAKRFTPAVGCIRSWNTNRKSNRENDYMVIIDNMMNLELLEWCGYHDIARKHADTTLKNHFRSDNSAYHIVVYNEKSGKIVEYRGGQGLGADSAWSRGQAWGLYGYTMMYRTSGDECYLQQAEKIANFLINKLDGDYIPNWDYHSPRLQKDSSAGAIMASALIELYTYTKNKTYLKVAKRQLKSLSSKEYLANENENGNFILKHGVGNLPGGSEIDVPLSYGDYYFIEAALRFLNL